MGSTTQARRVHHLRASAMLLSMGLMGAHLAACGSNGCDGTSYKAQPGRPVINDMKFLQQQADDPWTVIFSLDFADSGGDLGKGNLHLYTAGSTPAPPRALVDYFQASYVADTATSGTIAVPIPFADTVQDGQTVRLQVQLEDAAQPTTLFSNCYSVDMLFKVKPATAALTQAATRLATRLHEGLGSPAWPW